MLPIPSPCVRNPSSYYLQADNSGVDLPEFLRNTVRIVQSDDIPEFCKQQDELIPVRHVTRHGISGLSFRQSGYLVNVHDRDINVKIEKYLCQPAVVETEPHKENKRNITRFFSNLVSIRITSSAEIYTRLHQEIIITAPICTADSQHTGLGQHIETMSVLVSQDSCECKHAEQPDIAQYLQATSEEGHIRNKINHPCDEDNKISFFTKIWGRFKGIFHSDGKSGIPIISTVTETAGNTINSIDYTVILQRDVSTAAFVEELCQHSEKKTSFPVPVGQEFMPDTESKATRYTLPFYHYSLSPYTVKDATASQKIQIRQRKEAVKEDLYYDGALITREGAIKIGTLHHLDWHNLSGIMPATRIVNGNTIIYINGQNTPVYSQVRAMREIADVYNTRVFGIHTATHGHQFKDGLQSLEDKVNINTRPAKALEKLILNYLLKNNDKKEPLQLMAHSRGGIVTSHALTNVYEKLTQIFQQLPDVNKNKAKQIAKELMADIKVTTLAGGAYHYPEGPDYEHWINRKDPVPMLFGGGRYGKKEKDLHFFSETIRRHNVDTYLKQITETGHAQLSDDGNESTRL